MMNQTVCRPLAVATILLALTAPALAGTPLRGQARMADYELPRTQHAVHQAVMDSLSRVHPRQRARWLHDRGLVDRLPDFTSPTDSGPLRLVGRWSYGPSSDVDGRATSTDTLVALARGSGVSLLSFSRRDSLRIELLSDINAERILNQVMIRDTLLYVGTNAGLEIYDIADVRSPRRLSWIRTGCAGFDVRESLAYVTWYDTFKIYNTADPAAPYRVGVCQESGHAVAVTGNLALVADRWGLYLLDVSDPASPRRVNSWGSAVDAVTVRGNLAYVTRFNPNQPGELSLTILDVSNPQSVRQLGYLQEAGGWKVHLIDTLAYCSGDQDDRRFRIVSVADSTNPRLIGTGVTTGWNRGVWASGLTRAAFVANAFDGLQVFDISNTANPVRDTAVFGADHSVDISIAGDIAYVANSLSGLQVLGIADPTRPHRLGGLDTAGTRPRVSSVVSRDSFAYASWQPVPLFRSVDVTDPAQPRLVGGYDVFNPPQDMILRDSFCYVAQDRRFQILNVVRPREPTLVGTEVLPFDSWKAVLRDSLTYVANVTSVQMVNVADPSNPTIIGSLGGRTLGIDIRDTVLVTAGSYYGSVAWSIADPRNPRELGSLPLDGWMADVAMVDSFAYVGGSSLYVVDISNPESLHVVGTWSPPWTIRRLLWEPPYLYAACYEAGLCILEIAPTGMAERPRTAVTGSAVGVSPSVTVGPVWLELTGYTGPSLLVEVHDSQGRLQMRSECRDAGKRGRFRCDLSAFPAGVYFLSVRTGNRSHTARVVLAERR
ncbi:MAG: hypothetical protein R6X14_06430 [bacterium]